METKNKQDIELIEQIQNIDMSDNSKPTVQEFFDMLDRQKHDTQELLSPLSENSTPPVQPNNRYSFKVPPLVGYTGGRVHSYHPYPQAPIQHTQHYTDEMRRQERRHRVQQKVDRCFPKGRRDLTRKASDRGFRV